MYYGENDMEKPQLEQGAEPGSLEAKLSQTEAPAANRLDYWDSHGRTHDVQTWKLGDGVHVRAYDRSVGEPPERCGLGQSGYADAALERDPYSGRVDRMKIHEIHTAEGYRDSGLDSRMLEHMESEANKARAREIYEVLSCGSENEQAKRGFYEKQGYSFRPREGGGEDAYKRLR